MYAHVCHNRQNYISVRIRRSREMNLVNLFHSEFRPEVDILATVMSRRILHFINYSQNESRREDTATKINMINLFISMLDGVLVTVAWRVLELQMEG
jgi:hypothetical protein